jgi:hypothetical protein
MAEIALMQKAPVDLSKMLRDSKGIASFFAALPSAPIVANVTHVISTNITPIVTEAAKSETHLGYGPVIALIGLATVAFVVVRRH